VLDNDRYKKQQEAEQLKQILAKQKMYIQLFDTAIGREVMADLAKYCYVSTTTLDDLPHIMAFNEGRRAVYYYIKNQMEKDLKGAMEELTK